MKHMISLSLSLLVGISSINATLVTMPDKKVLTERLHAKGFSHFMEKTDIVKQLAGQKKEVMGVIMAVELSLYDYHNNLKNPMMSTMMAMRKPQLIETLLQDNPSAVKEAHGLLEEISKS